MLKDFKKTAIIAGEHEVSYSELLRRISQFAIHTPSDKSKTIILSENREGWIYSLFAIWLNRGIAVPVDATSTPHDVAYILNDCRPECIWTSRKKIDMVQEAMRLSGVTPELRLIDDYERQELSADIAPAEIRYDEADTCLIIYTSGTTGSPKGVMLSFQNILANIRSVSVEVEIFKPERRTLVLLPLHHVLPMIGTVVAPLMMGGGVAISPSMAAADLMQTLQRGKISIIVGVPRLWQTLYKGIKGKIDASPITRFLFWMCEKVGSRTLSRLIFKSVRQRMGGHIDYCVSGGAALDKEIGCGLRTLGLDVLEGYGMTEAAPIIAFTRPDDILPGSVGLPMPSVKVEIRNGEICAKGPNIMQGYYNRKEETEQVLQDGWLHTGDLGYFDDKGRLIITGRSKEIIVLSNGKNVQPNEIEYKLENYQEQVKEAAVVQDGDMLRAIIVPKPEWAGGMTDDEVEEALKRLVLEPYNQTVAPYKKLMSLFVYRDELPRTKLDKLQRFKLPALLNAGNHKAAQEVTFVEPSFEEYRVIKQYIREEKKCQVRPTDNIETDLAFDSLDKVGLQGFLEHTFGLSITVDQISAFHNITEMAEHVADYKTRIEVEKTDWNQILNESTHHLQLPSTSPTLGLVVKVFKYFAKLYFRLKTKGLENIPLQGPYILAANHQSYLDGTFVMAAIRYATVRNTYFFAKEKHVQHPFVKVLAASHNVVVMEPSNLRTSIQRLGEALKLGKNILIFPEGTRTETGELGEFKKTYAILSKELHVPVVPVSIRGAYDAMPKGTKVPRPGKVIVEYLPAIAPDAFDSYEALNDAVAKAVADTF